MKPILCFVQQTNFVQFGVLICRSLGHEPVHKSVLTSSLRNKKNSAKPKCDICVTISEYKKQIYTQQHSGNFP